jgi:ADP-ribosylglycohydrolase
MKSYTGYMDHATKTTLEKGTGSDSFDGSAIGRIAPLLTTDVPTSDEHIAEFIGFTHNHETVKAGAIFIAHIVRAIQTGKTPTEAIKETTSDSADILRFRDEGMASV